MLSYFKQSDLKKESPYKVSATNTPLGIPAACIWWARLDSNQRRIIRRIYSAMPLPLGD